MIGKKIKVFWPVDESWYSGVVHEYDVTTGEHLLRYSDGDTEWVKIGETMTNSSGHGGPAPTRGPYSAPEPIGGPPISPGQHKPNDPSRGYGPYGHPPPGYNPYQMPPHGMPPGGYHPMYGHPAYGGKEMGTPPRSGPHGEVGTPGSEGKRKAGPKAWTKEEDAILLQIVSTMSMPMKWSVVAQSLADRTGKQCRERYVNHLNPRLKVTDWTPVEDATIFHLYNTIGSHWAKMSKVIPGRTDNGIKNRFHNLRRQFEREDEHRLRLSSVKDFPEEIRLDRLRPFPDHLKSKSDALWDIEAGIGVIAAQSVLGLTAGRTQTRFGPFRKAEEDEQCVRCGFFVPSAQTGDELCSKTGWCISCSRTPPHVSSALLRECLNLRRAQDPEKRKIIESNDVIESREDTDNEDPIDMGLLEEAAPDTSLSPVETASA